MGAQGMSPKPLNVLPSSCSFLPVTSNILPFLPHLLKPPRFALLPLSPSLTLYFFHAVLLILGQIHVTLFKFLCSLFETTKRLGLCGVNGC